MDENKKMSDITIKEFVDFLEFKGLIESANQKVIPRLDAAQLLQVTPKTIDRWCRIGVLEPKVKIGGRAYVKSSSIDQKLKG